MASFDIKNLYTNIPIKETLEIIKTHLIEKKLEKEYTFFLKKKKKVTAGTTVENKGKLIIMSMYKILNYSKSVFLM